MLSFSIITAVRNGASTVANCIESVKEQSYPAKNREHIIIDGGSTDGTQSIIEKNRDYLSHLISEPDNGIYDAMNKGLALATGDLIGILNADDFYAGSHILERVAGVFEDPAIDSCYGDLVYVNAVNIPVTDFSLEPKSVTKRFNSADPFRVTRYWRAGDYNSRKFFQGWMPPHPTFFARRKIYERYGGFNLAMGTAADYELMLRFLARHGITVAYIPEVMVCMRTGGMSNASIKNRIMANRMDRKAWTVNGLKPYPWTLLLKPLRKIPQFFTKPPPLPISALT
jgi:glycosyltransferase